jgi:hypothetical protein
VYRARTYVWQRRPDDESSGTDSPNERWLGLAAGVSKIQNQGEIAVVDGNAGDINDARDALLQ